MAWELFDETIETGDNSPRTVELLRLKCFQDMLYAIGFRTSLNWDDKHTSYNLSIRGGLMSSIIQKVTKKIESKKPEETLKWEPCTDCYTECALTSMYQGALECVAEYLEVSLELPYEINQRMKQMKEILPVFLKPLRLFPINFHWTHGSSYPKNPVLEILCGAELTDKDLETVEFFWPGLKLSYTDPKDFPHLHKYIDQFIEYHLGGVRTPYGHIICGPSNEEIESISQK